MSTFSYQLYSSRNFPPLHSTLEMLASLGYQQVEGYDGLFSGGEIGKLDTLPAELEVLGLTMPTSHLGLELLRAEPQQVIDIAGKLGIKRGFVPAIPEEDRSADASAWQRLGEELESLNQQYTKSGLAIGWHNHAFEFVETKSGELPLDLIMQHAPSIELELDVAWVAVGGQNPSDWIKKYANRICSAHIKDVAPTGECVDEDGWADVGHGTLDWPKLMQELRQSGVEDFVMEHDNPSDHKRFAKRSIDYCQTL